ncbi:MAG: hypothetical protein ABIA75_02785 [Candidatus Neomarinimicrobiota bacterium]
MKNNLSFAKRKLLIIINIFMLCSTIIFYELFKNSNWTAVTVGILVSLLLAIIITYYVVFYKTRLWHLVHVPETKLDEREIQVTNFGLKYAYAIFTVTALVVIYWHNIAEIYVNGLTAAGLLYLAHILPASVIGWREEDIAWGNE